MASQSYEHARNRFFLDLHGVLKRDAGRVIRKRLQECCRYGIDSIEVVYGTPDFYDGSIASALYEAVAGNPQVMTGRLPREFLDAPEQYTQRVARVVLHLKGEPVTSPIDEGTCFTPFAASREPDVWRRRVCENWFFPLRESLSAAEAAQFIGDGCTAADIPQARVSMEQLEGLCRTRKRAVASVMAPRMEAEEHREASAPPLTAQEQWEAAWGETGAALAQHDYQRAQVQLQKCMEISAQNPDSILLARTLGALGDLRALTKHSGGAEPYYHSSLAAFESAGAPYSEERLEVESKLVQSLLADGRLAEAGAIWRRARERLAAEPSPHPAQSIYVLSNEAMLRARLDDLDTAGELLGQAVEVAEQSPAVPAISTATLRLHFGLLQANRGDLRRTVAQLSKAAEELEMCGAPSSQRLLCGRELAMAAAELGYRGRPEALLRELLAHAQAAGPAADRDRVQVLTSLGNILFREDRWSEAEACDREALEIALGQEEDLSPEIFMLRGDLGSACTNLGRYPEAEQEFQAALQMVDARSVSHNAVVNCKRNLAILYNRTGRYGEARALLEEVLLTLESFSNGPHPDTADAHGAYADVLIRLQDFAGAEEHLRAALQMKEAVFGAQGQPVGKTLTGLGMVLLERQKYTQARPVLQRAVDILDRSAGDRLLLAEAYKALAHVQHFMGNAKAAEKCARRAEYCDWLARQGR